MNLIFFKYYLPRLKRNVKKFIVNVNVKFKKYILPHLFGNFSINSGNLYIVIQHWIPAFQTVSQLKICQKTGIFQTGFTIKI